MGRESISGSDNSRKAAAEFDDILGQRLAERDAKLAVQGLQTSVVLHEGQHAGVATTGNDVGKSGSREL